MCLPFCKEDVYLFTCGGEGASDSCVEWENGLGYKVDVVMQERAVYMETLNV